MTELEQNHRDQELPAIEKESEARGGPVASTGQRLILILVAALVILFDHLTKLYIENRLPLNHTWAPLPELSAYFRITHVSNTGAAFGLFPGGSLFFTVIALIVAAVIIIYNYRLPSGNRLLRVALGLQLGGALGNLVDRLRLGHVTDYPRLSDAPGGTRDAAGCKSPGRRHARRRTAAAAILLDQATLQP